jgi:hypothetical protein
MSCGDSNGDPRRVQFGTLSSEKLRDSLVTEIEVLQPLTASTAVSCISHLRTPVFCAHQMFITVVYVPQIPSLSDQRHMEFRAAYAQRQGVQRFNALASL